MSVMGASSLLRRLISGTNRYGEFTAPLSDDEIPRYPPFQKGLPAVHSHRLLVTQRELIRELQVAADIDDELWEAFFVPMIERYAAFVHLLPASEAHHHRGAGGLFRHGLETALYALRLARQHLFDTELPPKQVKSRKPRWSATIFVAGMCHDLGKPITDVRVRNYAGTEEWPAWTISLDQWLHGNRIDHYVLEWVPGRKGDHETVTDPVVFWQVVNPRFIEWLAAGGKDFMPALQRALRTQDAESRIARLVAAGDRTSVEKDLQKSPVSSGLSLGVPVERHIIEGMRHLISTGTWKINVPGARLWHLKSKGESGLYVVWTQASVQELRDYFTHYMLNGVPHSPEGIADALIERAFVQEQRSANGAARFWSIAPLVLNHYKPPKDAEKLIAMPLNDDRPADAVVEACRLVALRALRLTSPAVLFDYNEPPPPIEGFVEGEIHAEAERRAATLVMGSRRAAVEVRPPDGHIPPRNGPTNNATSESEHAKDERTRSGSSDVAGANEGPQEQNRSEMPASAAADDGADCSSVFSGLSAALTEFLLAHQPEDALSRLDNGQWMIGYPEAVERHLRQAEGVLEELKRLYLIEPHPKVRTRWVHDYGDRRGLLLTQEASKALDEQARRRADARRRKENDRAAHSESSLSADDKTPVPGVAAVSVQRPAPPRITERRRPAVKRGTGATADSTSVNSALTDPAGAQPPLTGLDTQTSDQALIGRLVRTIYQALVAQDIRQDRRAPEPLPPSSKKTDAWVLFDRDDVQALCNRRCVLLDLQGKPLSFSRLSAIAGKSQGLLEHSQTEGFFFNTTRLSLAGPIEAGDER